MSMKTARKFACVPPKALPLGEKSNTFFGFWIGVCSAGFGGVADGGWIGWMSVVVHVGWLNDIQFNVKYDSIDIDSIIPFNGHSPRHIPGSQDINPMLRINSKMPVPTMGWRNPGPPERGRGPISRPLAGRDTRRRKSRAKHEGRTPRVRVWFARQNSDSRQDIYAPYE
jgi:hypothetical protein